MICYTEGGSEAATQAIGDAFMRITIHHPFADRYGETYFNNVAQLAKQWMYSYFNTDSVSFADLEISLNRERLINSVFRLLHQALYPDTRIFPTERAGFVIFPSCSHQAWSQAIQGFGFVLTRANVI
jgi:hypothetical protein